MLSAQRGGWFSSLSLPPWLYSTSGLGLLAEENRPTSGLSSHSLHATHLPIIGALGRVTLPGQMAPHLSSWGVISQPVVQVHTPPGGFLSYTHMN